MKKGKLAGIAILTIACCTVFTYAKKLDYTLDHIQVGDQVVTIRIEKARQQKAVNSIKELILNQENINNTDFLDQAKDVLVNKFQVENASITAADVKSENFTINNVTVGDKNARRGVMAFINEERLVTCSIKQNDNAISTLELAEPISGVATVSVIAPTSTEAKEIVLSVKNLNCNQILEKINKINGAECIVIAEDKTIHTTMPDSAINIINKDFNLK